MGDNARIYAKSLAVNAEKKAVNATWTNKDVEINGTISSGSKQLPGGKIYINTTDKAQSDNELTISDLSSTAMDLLNLLSNQNYYLEAVGGSASTVGSSFTGAGSFTVLVMEDTVEALVGNSVVLVLTDGLKVTAASKVERGSDYRFCGVRWQQERRSGHQHDCKQHGSEGSSWRERESRRYSGCEWKRDRKHDRVM